MSDEPDLAALLGSRICHDLISPLGAIGNGVELLGMTGAGAAPEVALIAESADNASARIRFFRVAFGLAGTGQGLGAQEVRAILADVYRHTRLSVSWEADVDATRREVKLAFLLLLCLETAMPWGGRIAVQRSEGHWRLHGTAERLSVNRDLFDLLSRSGASAEVNSANVHFPIALTVAEQLGRPITCEFSEGLISLAC